VCVRAHMHHIHNQPPVNIHVFVCLFLCLCFFLIHHMHNIPPEYINMKDVYIYIYIYICFRVCVRECVCVYVRVRKYTHPHTYTAHTYMHNVIA